MTPDDLTRPSPPDATRDAADAALDAGLAAAFADDTNPRPPADPEAGTVVAGRYKLTEKIGEGGMGSVWVAHQTEPVKRKVAVKLIKAGMDSKAVLARFDAERQALAVMDHPNIAKVLDGGVHDGRPYFVMELVKGVPITDFCDARKLTPRQRLELFVPVCQAIQHAHQKGVIHRDIKPGNVLVALYDDTPVPKVIDFGVAKATGAALTEHTLETGFGAVVGTPQYMSPEQATLNNLDIDTRSDVYALGVLLYELLTGSPPFSKQELEKKGLLELLRVVREEEPPRPSAKLSTAETLPSIAAARGTEPKKLTGLLRNELDWVVMKALEKDRTRRYETANGFAADIQRYLSGEPVQAHPPSTAYRLKKFARKHKTAVGVSAAFAAVLVAAAAVSLLFGLLAGRAEQQARENEGKAHVAEREAKKSAEFARTANLRVLDAMKRLADTISDRNRVVVHVTDGLAAHHEDQFYPLPAAERELMDAILGYYEAFTAEINGTPDDLRIQADCFSHIAAIHETFGARDSAVNARRAALRLIERRLGPRPEQPDDRLTVCYAHVWLAEALHKSGQHPEAMGRWSEVVVLADTSDTEIQVRRLRGLAWAGKVNEVVTGVEELSRKSPLNDYDVACLYALASAACHGDAMKRDSLAEDAIHCLERWAPKVGQRVSKEHLVQLKLDPDLTAVRNRAEFIELFARLEGEWQRIIRFQDGPRNEREVLPPPRAVK